MCGSGQRTGDEGSVAAGPQRAAVAMAQARLGGGLGRPGHDAHLGALPAQEGGKTAVVQTPPAMGPPGSPHCLGGHLHEVTRRAGLGVKGARETPLQAAPSQASSGSASPTCLSPGVPASQARLRQTAGLALQAAVFPAQDGRPAPGPQPTDHSGAGGGALETQIYKGNSQGGTKGATAESTVSRAQARVQPSANVTGLSRPFLFGSWAERCTCPQNHRAHCSRGPTRGPAV